MLLTELIELHSSHDVYLVGLGGEGRFSSDAIDNVFVGVMYLDLVWSVWCLQIHSLLAACYASLLSFSFLWGAKVMADMMMYRPYLTRLF